MEKNSKLYLKLIGILLILIPFVDLVLNNGLQSLERGFQDGQKQESFEFIQVIPNSKDILPIQLPDINGKINVEQIELKINTKKPLAIYPFYIWPIYVIFGCLILFNLIALIRLLKRFINGHLFEVSTYNTLLYFGFSIIGISIVDAILELIKNHQLSKYIENSQFSLAKNNLYDIDNLLIGLFIIAFAIALRQSIRMKEENDLTI